MSGPAVAVGGLTLVAGLASAVPLALALAVAAGLRAARGRAEARRAGLDRELLPLLVEVISDGELPAGTRLTGLSRAGRARVEELVVPLVNQLCGSERARLVAVLERDGSMARAERGCRSRRLRRSLRAIEFLGAVGGPAQAEVLLGRLGDRDRTVRTTVVRAIGRIGAADAVPRLMDSLADSGPRTVPTHAVTMAVLRCGAAARGPLVRALRHPDPAVREHAVDLLGWLGPADDTDRLQDLAVDPDEEVRETARRALRRLGLPEPQPVAAVGGTR